MKILSPVKNAKEAKAVVAAGAGELYCGVLPRAWNATYTNMASPNRREWRSSNMDGFDELAAVVKAAHAGQARVFLTLNALYTEGQYPQIEGIIKDAATCGVDAVIVADLGLLLALRRLGWKGDIHISTGGTTFNDETVGFYKDLGATRVILPRHNRVNEIAAIVRHNRDIEIETFIMNRGCMNIDGFCTYHHGASEIRSPLLWGLPKKLNCDYYLLQAMKKMPAGLRRRLGRSGIFKSDSACFIPYHIGIKAAGAGAEGVRTLKNNLERNFNLFSGFDTCGACALWDLEKAGVCSLKIVGRENALQKKLQDVTFLKACLDHLRAEHPARAAFDAFVRAQYHKVFGYACHNWCYFPEEDRKLGEDEI